MDEWVMNGREVPEDFPLSFARTDRELLFDRIRPDLKMPEENIHFPKADTRPYIESWKLAKCLVMQGGQGEVKHWAFNDPPKREAPYQDSPPSPAEYRRLTTRIVDLHPMTIIQNARTSGGGVVTNVPTQAISVGPAETWLAEKVSIWQAGNHDNPFGQRLTALLADHPNVQFNYLRGGIGACDVEMH
jgi:glucosamine-6-phosphate deaminase